MAILTDRYRQYPTRAYRRTLAEWIARPDNPLTARVMVNRIWQHHFGHGIIDTPSDFGKNGDRPSHPELLDWLAVRFVDEGWSVKAMHRLMLTSNTYRQAADNPVANDTTIDPDNRLLWRFLRRRLEGEVVRDSLLFLSGRLNLERGGPSVFPPLPKTLARYNRPAPIGGLMWEPNEKQQDARRRSIYIFQRRSLPLPMLQSFDAPVFNESCARRSMTTTLLQALSMMNSDMVHEQAKHLAARVRNDAGPDPADRIDRTFEIVLNRLPEPDERERMARFGNDLTAICRILMNTNELLYTE